MREDDKTMMWMRGQAATIKRGRRGWQTEWGARCRSIFPDRSLHIRVLIQGRQEPRRRRKERCRIISSDTMRFGGASQPYGEQA